MKANLKKSICILLVCLFAGLMPSYLSAKNIVSIEMKSKVSLKEALINKLGSDHWTEADSLIISGELMKSDYETLYWCAAAGNLRGLNMSKVNEFIIPDNAFHNNSDMVPICRVKLEYITLPENLVGIGYSAFMYLDLKTITFPESLESIGIGAFQTDDGMGGELRLPGKIKEVMERSFSGCDGLKNVVFPEGLIEIHKCAFEECNLDSIVLPKKIEVIESQAFYNAVKSKVYSYALTPPDCYGKGERSPFFGCYDCTLYVPAEAIEAYKSTYPWSEFKQILPIGEDSGVEDIVYDSVEPEQPIYDLMGRKVTKLIPGQIYIRAGKKFVAPKD